MTQPDEPTIPSDEDLTHASQLVSAGARDRMENEVEFAARVNAAAIVIASLPQVPQTQDVQAAIVMATAMTLHMVDAGQLTVTP